MVNMAGNSRQTSSTKMSKCNWTNELVNELIDLVEEREVIWNAKCGLEPGFKGGGQEVATTLYCKT
jgi:hypothetical protein